MNDIKLTLDALDETLTELECHVGWLVVGGYNESRPDIANAGHSMTLHAAEIYKQLQYVLRLVGDEGNAVASTAS